MKLITYVRLFSTFFVIVCFPKPLVGNEMNTARLLLAHLRGGDYAHAGDKEAIDMVIEKALKISPQLQNGICLDVGSGLGGTASYIYNLGFSSVCGVDLDQAAIEYAQKRYPQIPFLRANANDIARLFAPDFFSFIYMFNVLYAIEDKASVLKNLYEVAKPGALLVLFDYTIEGSSFDIKDLAGKPMYPMVLTELEQDLKEARWEVLQIDDLSESFFVWYQALLGKLDTEQASLLGQFSDLDIAKVKTTFNGILQWLTTSQLGGAVIYARKPG